MNREIIFEKSLFETRKFILKYNSRYTSKIVGRSTRVKSAQWAWQNIQESVTDKSERVF